MLASERILVGARAERLDELAANFDRHLIMEDAEFARAPDVAWRGTR